jgi:hypothetical protein
MAKITKTVAQNMLGNVPEEKRFWCSDGRYLNNLEELRDALNQMSAETFSYHSNEIKTDFTNWVKDVIGDAQLARDLLNATQTQAAKAVAERIDWLKGKAGLA